MNRFIYRAVLKDGAEGIQGESIKNDASTAEAMVGTGKLMTLSMFKNRRNLFLYYECINEYIPPQTIFPGLSLLLEIRPDEDENKTWIPMIDIFHFATPAGTEHWRRKAPVEKRIGKIARIKPEMLSSYIYYHYMLQEGQSHVVNKYCMIGLDENLIFYYEEQPVTEEAQQYKGNLDTALVPPDWQDTWQELMGPHFIPWKDACGQEDNLKNCEIIFKC